MPRGWGAKFAQMDWPSALAGFALLAFGFAAIYSVELSHGGDLLNLKKQAAAAAISLTVYIVAAFSNYRLLRNYALVLYVAGIVFLLAVLILGITVNGTTGWFSIGLFHFQPVEFMKVALAVALAAYFSERARRRPGWKEIFESGAIAGLPVILTALQPDLGSAILLAAMWGSVLLLAGLRLRHIVALAIVGVLLAVPTWHFFLADYQRARFTNFLNPGADPLGSGYNVTQAVIAVGAGGWFGRGLGFGSQSQLKFLPESQTDFIFAVVAEELGFFGIALLLAAFFLLLLRIYRLSVRATDDFTSFLLLAIGAALLVQCVVNMGMNLGMLPVTGVTLPLVSYGGSSLLFTSYLLGIAQSVALHARVSE